VSIPVSERGDQADSRFFERLGTLIEPDKVREELADL
jgi:hypothetical protein